MKKIAMFAILILIVAGVSLFYHAAKQPVNFVIFASSENLNNDLREALINRLETNDIAYQIAGDGSVKIPDKEVKHAVMCCS
ncbi:hypothetical protein ACFPYJ_09965 [Paenibacillus solisilvae]|uniref:Uncharacterized protein n=1 Tax=Paenibacillus solisilvae TaxID=2486751 RepID=A0ABW0VU92_9BACL